MPEVFPLSEVRPGLTGHVETVLDGGEVTSIDVELLGVMDDWIGPGVPVVIGRFVDETGRWKGVASGMSGSPVFVDGRLLGALSYRIGAFNKEPICGITPIERMLELDSYPSRPLSWLPEGSRSDGPPLRAIPMTLSVSGLSRGTIEGLEDVKQRLREHLPVARIESAAAAAGPAGEPGADALVPGRAVSVLLVWGDMQVGATGTVTWRDGDRLLAFGHPFLGSGRVELPIAPARVIWTIPSMLGSFKLSSFGRPAGTLTQDRLTAIEGRLGEPPEGLPVRLDVDRQGAPRIERRFVLARSRELTPTLAIMAVQGAVRDALGAEGDEALVMDGELLLADGSRLPVEGFGAGEGQGMLAADPSAPLAIRVASVLGALMQAPVPVPEVERLELRVRSIPRAGAWSVTRAMVDRTVARPGEEVRVTADLVGPRGMRRSESLRVQVPADALPGEYELLVGSELSVRGKLGSLAEARRRTARTTGEYLQAVREEASERRLVARLVLPAEGLVRHGREYPALPGSAHQLLRAQPPRGEVYRSRWLEVAGSGTRLDRGLTGLAEASLKILVE
jgi:hypothetical protein